SNLKPAPRSQFAPLKDVKCGDSIIIPPMGQSPKDFGKYNKGSILLITEQMLELWDKMQGQQRITYRRVLSGPMGVGKSYLSYFLAARAYAEGWLILYISDAGVLDTEEEADSYMQVIERFLVMNKDVLTAAELEKLVCGYNGQWDIWSTAITPVFNILMQKKRKTLTVVDEHGMLFRSTIPVPAKFISLKPLMDLASWTDGNLGSHLILTGTAHAKYELEVMEPSYRCDYTTVVFVGPLSENDFLELLKNVTNLNPVDVEEIVKVTNRVPRELMQLDTFVQENSGLPVNEALSKFEIDRKGFFAEVAENYYKRIKEDHFSRERFFHGLAQAFLYGSGNGNFKWDFLDLGLLYRFKRDGSTLFLPLCNATQKALLELFKLMPMPENLMRRLKANNINGDDFE
ncbi:hypothetical protein BGX21_005485, partial [Mortierella sp. AD011]